MAKVPRVAGIANGAVTPVILQEDYSADLDKPLHQLAPNYSSAKWTRPDGLVIFLTGATGFLGAYILRELLIRPNHVAQVICLVRARSAAEATDRVRESGTNEGIWDEHWVSNGRLLPFCGDLSAAKYGLSDVEWNNLVETTDVILHNEAMVNVVDLCHISY